jgi:hypothetical protein
LDSFANIKPGSLFFYNSTLWTKIEDSSGWNAQKQLSSGEMTYAQIDDDVVVDVVLE